MPQEHHIFIWYNYDSLVYLQPLFNFIANQEFLGLPLYLSDSLDKFLELGQALMFPITVKGNKKKTTKWGKAGGGKEERLYPPWAQNYQDLWPPHLYLFLCLVPNLSG